MLGSGCPLPWSGGGLGRRVRDRPMIRRHRITQRIEQRRRKPTFSRNDIEKIVRRHTRHAQHPIDDLLIGVGGLAHHQRAIGTPHDRHRITVKLRRSGLVQLQFAQREPPPRLQRREVQERQPHRLLQLPHRIGADEHQRDVRLHRRRARQPAKQRHRLGLFRRRGHVGVRDTACRSSSRPRQPVYRRCGRAAGTACPARTRSASG